LKTKILTTLMLLPALLTVHGAAQISTGPVSMQPERATELSYTYSTLRTNAPVGGCGCFWNSGGSVELAVPLWRHFSSVTEFSGDRENRVTPTNKTLAQQQDGRRRGQVFRYRREPLPA
jgi:hypothetical protein